VNLPTDHNVATAPPDVKGFHLLCLLMVLTIALAVRMEFFVGCLGTDDLAAWNRAAKFAQGQWTTLEQNINFTATLRYGLSVPVAGIFALFGVSETTANIFPLLMSLLAVAAVWDLTRRLTGSLAMACIAALWLAMIGLDISYATVLLPDGPLSSLGVLCMWAMVVGIHQSDDKRVVTSVLFFLSGFLAGYAISLKLPGIGLIVMLCLWAVSSLILKQWQSRMWWILGGFVLAVILEHTFFWVMHGDPLSRWIAILKGLKAHRQTLVRTGLVPEEQDLAYYFGHVFTWLARFARVAPSAALTIAATLIAAIHLLIARWRDAALRLLVCFVVVFVIFRVPEFMKTYSFQPRRLLPLAALGPVMTLVALWYVSPRRIRWAARSIFPMVIGFAMVILVTLVLFGIEKPYLRSLQYKLAVEREMWSWIKNHEAEVESKGFFADHRTLRTVNALSGFALGTRNVHTYPAYWGGKDGNIVEPRPPLYTVSFWSIQKGGTVVDLNTLDQGYWGVNPRIVRWFRSKRTMTWLEKSVRDIPEHWGLQKVTGTFEDLYGNNGAIYRIRPPGAKEVTAGASWLSFIDAMDGNMTWRVYPPESQVHPIGNREDIEVEISSKNLVQLVSPIVAWNRETAGVDGDFMVSAGVFPLRADVDRPLSHSLFSKLTRYPRIYLYVEAYDDEQRLVMVHRSRTKIEELPTTLRAYVRKPAWAESLQVRFSFHGGGAYRLEPIRVLPAASNNLHS
jgi:hypothetical protein